MSALVTIFGEIRRETERAYFFVEEESEAECWLPKSQIDYIRPKGWAMNQRVEIDIPRWLADKNDLNFEGDQ